MKRMVMPIVVAIIAFAIAIDANLNLYCKFYPPEIPVVNPPLALRQSNWRGSKGEGSCVWATTITLLRWQGQEDLANLVKNKCGNGVKLGKSVNAATPKLDTLDIRYAIGRRHDESFLRWAIETRRGAGVAINSGSHMVAIVDMTDTAVCLLDNNHIGQYFWVTKDRFLVDWHKSWGFAFTPVYSPTSPLP